MIREKKTVSAMIKIYCGNKHHEDKRLCRGCQELLDYAITRLDKCPFQERKTTCAKCSIHCYREPMKSKIRSIMRFSGPRMLGRHPILAILHIKDRFRKEKKP
jgi:hypothetical protein